MSQAEFANPEFLWLFLLIPLMALYYILKLRKHSSAILISDIKPLIGQRNLRVILRHFLPLLRLAAIAFLIVALARPQIKTTIAQSTEGIDIAIALDVSTSMEARDFNPSRIEAAKKAALDFIDKRKNDRIALIVFAAQAVTHCPLTNDKNALKQMFSEIQTGMLDDGTAIGDGAAMAVRRLKNSPAKTKIVILLTDGLNNAGMISPASAAEITRSLGVRIYSIGVGTEGVALYPFKTPFGYKEDYIEVKIDEKILADIAESTGGKYFRAKDNNSLNEIYNEIDSLEKSKFTSSFKTLYDERYLLPVLLSALLVFIELLLQLTLLRKLP